MRRSAAPIWCWPGTIATQDPKHGVAIISDGGPSKVYSVGDNVSGATLHSVYLDHVILDRAGVLETLLLPRQLAGEPADGRRPPVPAAPIPRTVAAVDNIRRMVQQDPGSAGPSHAHRRRPTTMRPASCADFAPIRAETVPFLTNWV